METSGLVLEFLSKNQNGPCIFVCAKLVLDFHFYLIGPPNFSKKTRCSPNISQNNQVNHSSTFEGKPVMLREIKRNNLVLLQKYKSNLVQIIVLLFRDQVCPFPKCTDQFGADERTTTLGKFKANT